MGKKLDKIKELQKKDKNVVVDKTFGLKNKSKSKKVQQFVQQVKTQSGDARADALRDERKRARSEKIQAEMELKALFSEGLSITVKKKDLHNKKQQEGTAKSGGGGGPSEHYDDAWAEAQLAKEDLPQGVEERIERLRAELRAKGLRGTPVTAETFAAWKSAKRKRILDEKLAQAKQAEIKKKSMKHNKSTLSGKDLYTTQKDLFVDDDEAVASTDYILEAEAADENYDENGRSLKEVEEEEEVEDTARVAAAATTRTTDTSDRPMSDHIVQLGVVNEALYADDAGLDDLDDLDDDT